MKEFQDHFSSKAEAYARYRPSYPPALVDFLESLCRSHALAWDCGCGSGQLSVLLGERFERVVATDASARQLRHAKPHPRVEYRRASAERSGLAEASVDLCVAAQAAHWFDLEAYFGQVNRVARPKSAVALVAYGVFTINRAVDAVVGRFYRDVLGPYWPPERRSIDDGYQSLPFPFREVVPPRLEMAAQWTLEQVVGYIRTWSAVSAMERARGTAPFEELRIELARAWGAHPSLAVRWPLAIRAGHL